MSQEAMPCRPHAAVTYSPSSSSEQMDALIIGFGRAGAGLHLPALRKLARLGGSDRRTRSVYVLDPRLADLARRAPNDITVVQSYDSLARAGIERQRTVVHLCTPPRARAEAVEQLAAAGFRRFIVEKPIADRPEDLAALGDVLARYELDLLVMGNFVVSAVTRRLAELISSGRYGALRSLAFEQHKPRFARSLENHDHATAFDVELPHALGAALSLAGTEAEVVGARCTDLAVGSSFVPHLGTAELTVRHRSGVVTHMFSDLTSPIRKRSIEARFDEYVLLGHYPVSEADNHAQLTLHDHAGRELYTHVLTDDSTLMFMVDSYNYFEGHAARPRSDFELNSAIVTLLIEAKSRCGIFAPAGPDEATR
jgi:predicted dehydrogenase